MYTRSSWFLAAQSRSGGVGATWSRRLASSPGVSVWGQSLARRDLHPHYGRMWGSTRDARRDVGWVLLHISVSTLSNGSPTGAHGQPACDHGVRRGRDDRSAARRHAVPTTHCDIRSLFLETFLTLAAIYFGGSGTAARLHLFLRPLEAVRRIPAAKQTSYHDAHVP